MVDRQDIDALLIGALYGELTPAEEARLTTHLESHPADRTALADLTRARSALHESRILTVQLEPPQSVSALLLQEAARRAPRPVAAKSEEREGWFQRFVHSFAARPMMAAAAMLVLLLGVAGTIKMTGRDADSVERAERADRGPEAPALEPAPSPPTESAVAGNGDAYRGAATAQQPASGSSYDVTLREEGTTKTAEVRPDPKPDEAKPKAGVKADTGEAKITTKRAEGNTYLEVSPPAPNKPKDLDDELGADRQKQQRRFVEKEKKVAPDVARDSNAPGAGDAGGTTGGVNAPTTVDSSRGTGRNPPPIVTTLPPQAPAQGRATEDLKDEDLSAARTAHNDVVAAAKTGDCVKASKLAADLAARAPSYYQTQVHTDRELKNCISRINAERDTRDRAQRAPKRVDEPARSKPSSRK